MTLYITKENKFAYGHCLIKFRFLLLIQLVIGYQGYSPSIKPIVKQDVIFNSDGTKLAGTLYSPNNVFTASYKSTNNNL